MRQSFWFLLQAIGLVGVTSALSTTLAKQKPLHVPDAGPSNPLPPSDPSFPQDGVFSSGRHRGDDMISALRGDGKTGHSLADVLTRARDVAVWWEYARDVAAVSARLQSRNEGTTVLVPTNEAMKRLSRKPHQNPDGSEDDAKVKDNVDRFISAHVIPEFVTIPTDGEVATLLPGKKVKIERVGEGPSKGWVVQPGDIPVEGFAEVNKGRILFMGGVIDVD